LFNKIFGQTALFGRFIFVAQLGLQLFTQTHA